MFEFDYLAYFRNMVFVIGLVTAIAYILVKLKTSKGSLPLLSKLSLAPSHLQDKQVQVIERITLEPRKSLYLVEVRNQSWLIGTTDTQIQLIGRLDQKETERDQTVHEQKSFSDYLRPTEDNNS